MEKRNIVLNLIAMLLNFRTRRVGLNQLSSTFYPPFEAVGNDALCVKPNEIKEQLLHVTFSI